MLGLGLGSAPGFGFGFGSSVDEIHMSRQTAGHARTYPKRPLPVISLATADVWVCGKTIHKLQQLPVVVVVVTVVLVVLVVVIGSQALPVHLQHAVNHENLAGE